MKSTNIQRSRLCVTSVRCLCIPCVIQPASTHSSHRVLSFSQPQMFSTSASPEDFSPQNPVMWTADVRVTIRDLFTYVYGHAKCFGGFPRESNNNCSRLAWPAHRHGTALMLFLQRTQQSALYSMPSCSAPYVIDEIAGSRLTRTHLHARGTVAPHVCLLCSLVMRVHPQSCLGVVQSAVFEVC